MTIPQIPGAPLVHIELPDEQFPPCLQPLVLRIRDLIADEMADWIDSEALGSFQENPTVEKLIDPEVQDAISEMAKMEEEVPYRCTLKELNRNALQWIRYFSGIEESPATTEPLTANIKNLSKIFSELVTDRGFDHIFSRAGWNKKVVQKFVDAPTISEFLAQETYFCTLQDRFFHFKYEEHFKTAIFTKSFRTLNQKDFQRIIPSEFKRIRPGDVAAIQALAEEVRQRGGARPLLENPVPIPAERVDNPYGDGIQGEPKTAEQIEARRGHPLRIKGELFGLGQSIQERIRLLQSLDNQVAKQDPTLLNLLQHNTQENLTAAQPTIAALIAGNPVDLPTIQELREKKEFGKVYTDPRFTIDSLRRYNDAAQAWLRFSRAEGPLPPVETDAYLDALSDTDEIEKLREEADKPEEPSLLSTITSWLSKFWKWITCSSEEDKKIPGTGVPGNDSLSV